jgi:hypothetical protein
VLRLEVGGDEEQPNREGRLETGVGMRKLGFLVFIWKM